MLEHFAKPRRRTAWALVALAFGVAIFSAGSEAAATSDLKGTITLQRVAGPACGSPIAFCATGTIAGKLKGTLELTGTSLTPTVDTPTTAVILLTSDVTVTTDVGTLLFKDASVLRTTGAGELSGIWTVVGGTGSYAGAVGAIQITGALSEGAGTARYIGSLSFP